MNNKPDCHPDAPEGGQQANRQEKLDTSSCQPKDDHWENPRICVTCIHFKNCLNNGDPYFCEDASEPNPCPRYIPKSK